MPNGREKKIRLVTYKPHNYKNITEESVKLLADAGIDVGILSAGALEKDRWSEIFDWYHKYGMQILFHDNNISSPLQLPHDQRAMAFDDAKAENIRPYLDHPAFLGSSFVDEPGYLHYEALGETVRQYSARFPDKMPYINLLPMYANNAQLAGGAWMDKIEYYDAPPEGNRFQYYIDRYVELVPTDYIGVDIYPCRADSTYSDYVKSIEIVAEACRKSGREFWICVQTCSWHKSVRQPSETDLRWQIFTMLAFGAVSFQYYVFTCDQFPSANGEFQHLGAPVDYDGTRQQLWFTSRKIASELRALSPVYVGYSYAGAFPVSCTDKTPYLAMYNPLPAFDAIKDIRCEKPMLVGCFNKNEDAGSACMLVNMTDLSVAPEALEAKIRFSGPAVAYYGGQPLPITPDSDGYCSFVLPAGEGVFVTVE